MRKRFFALFLTALLAAAVPVWAEESLPVSCDLRALGLVPTGIRNQNPYGTCWAFSALAAVESNYMVGVSEDANFAVAALGGATNKNPDTAEMHLSWFVYKAPEDKEYMVFSIVSGDQLLSMKDLKENPTKVLEGANWDKPAAFLSRGYGFGPIPEDSLEYGEASVKQLASDDKAATAYTPSVLWVTDVSNLSYPQRGDKDFATKRAAIIKEAKALMLQKGALSLSYTDGDNSRNEENKTYFCSEADLETLKDGEAAGHAVAVVGWDDTFPAASFDVEGREKPTIDGAWLIRNSWGTPKDHDNGYFWMSYDQQVAFHVYTVDSTDSAMNCYLWDALGWCSEWSEENEPAYALNLFKAADVDMTLKKIGFYTEANDVSVDLYVKVYGTSRPSEVELGALAASEIWNYPGYHSISVDQAVAIPANSYFSVAMRVEAGDTIAVESRVKGFSDYARIFDGQSYFSTDGTTWTDGTQMTVKGESVPMNACIKAFLYGAGGAQPEETDAERIINGKLVVDRPDDTVDEALVKSANAGKLEGRTFTLTLVDENGDPLPKGTEAMVTFQFLGTESDYNKYYVGGDDGEERDQGYDEHPDATYLRKMYPAGYEPHVYVDNDGTLYPAYTGQDYVVTLGEGGKVTLSAGDLPTASEGKTIPVGYYDVYYEADVDGTNTVGSFPLITVTASSVTSRSGGSGGCNAGLFGVLSLAGLAILALRKGR